MHDSDMFIKGNALRGIGCVLSQRSMSIVEGYYKSLLIANDG